MPESDITKDVMELRERIVRLEVKVEEMSKRLESISGYAKELYNYLQKQSNRPMF
jgi:tetrahydromethanopterin S-methyltransferase subunit B